MKLRNKKTGEIVTPACFNFCLLRGVNNRGIEIKGKWYNSLTEISKEWEDCEEPKEYWCITGRGNLHYLQDITDENDKDHREIGNYFETEEEAEKAVEKLKAWKRLKDNGFKFRGLMENWISTDGNPLNCFRTGRTIHFNKQGDNDWLDENWKDLLLLFGGEE